jgi:HPt (histidine-containing phosphotransfer) domain-containing protein
MDEPLARSRLHRTGRAMAHWLKGAGGSMGFDALFEPAKALEDACKTNDLHAAKAVMAQLRDLVDRIQRGAVSDTPLEEATP